MALKNHRKRLLLLAVALTLLLTATACGKAGGEAVQRGPTSQGDPAAQVVIMAFTDFQCAQCKQFVEQVMPQIVEEYVDTGVVRLQHRHSAAIGEESYRAAMASECAAEQGRFWEYHSALFAMQEQPNSGAFSDETLRGLARTVGLDGGSFAACMDSGLTRAIVDTDMQAAAELGVSSVPTLVINGAVVSGLQDYTTYQTAIGQAWIDID